MHLWPLGSFRKMLSDLYFRQTPSCGSDLSLENLILICRRTTHPSLPGTVLVYTCCPCVIIHSVPFPLKSVPVRMVNYMLILLVWDQAICAAASSYKYCALTCTTAASLTTCPTLYLLWSFDSFNYISEWYSCNT